MGSSSSRAQRQRLKSNSSGKEDGGRNTLKGEKENIHINKNGKETGIIERQDSKQFWVSHIRRRSASGSEGKGQQVESRSGPPDRSKSNSKQIEDFEQKKYTSSPNDLTEINSGGSSSPSLSSETASNTANGQTRSSSTEVVGNSNVTNTQEQKDDVISSTLGLQVISIYELYNYLNDGSINPCMCDPSYLLLFDTRDKFSYEKLHIVGSKQSSALHTEILATNLHSLMTTGSRVALDEFTFVIVYGNRLLDPKDTATAEVNFLKELESYEDVKPMFLASGFESFYEVFPFLCTEKVMTRHDLKEYKTYPSIVLIDQLYQGRGDQATNSKIINDLKITHVVNISCEHKSAFPDRVKYLTINLEDVSQANLKPYFPKAYNFIDDCFKSGGRVLVHCNLGVSRSSTITISYLMKSRKWNMKVAHDFLKDRRSCVRPNRGFLQQLSAWEVEVLGEKITDVDELWF